MENCGEPAIITKDLCVRIQGRSGGHSLKNLFSTNRNPDHNRLTGLYELILRKNNEGNIITFYIDISPFFFSLVDIQVLLSFDIPR